MTFEALLEIMAQHGITRLAHIARELDASPQTVSNWKARDQVPYKITAIIKAKYGGSVETDEEKGAQDQEKSTENGQPEIQHPTPGIPYSNPPDLSEEEDSMPLREIINILKKYWKILIIIPTITCIVAIYYVFFIAQPFYVATAKIIPSVGSSSTSNLRGLAAQFGFSVPGGEENSITSSGVYPEIIQSRTLARALLKRNFNTEKFGEDQPLMKILTYSEEEPEFGPDTLEKMAVKALLKKINVSKSRQSSILKLEVSAIEPQLAADIITALIEELAKHQQKFKSTRVSEKRQFIEGRIEEVQVDLEKAEDALKQFRYRNRQIQNSPSLLLEEERLSREVQVITGVYTTLKQEYELTKIQEVEEATVVHVLDPPEAPLMRAGPQRRKTVIMAGFLGIALGVGLAFGREYWKNISEKDLQGAISQ
jgi:uncharacterized protein involved in exopolysaccharide biosynthesis